MGIHQKVFADTNYKPATFVELLLWRAEHQTDEMIYTYLLFDNQPDIKVTLGELDRKSRAVAAWLQSMHLEGERAILLYPPGMDYITAFLGCLYAGVVAVPAYPPEPSRLDKTLPRIQAIVKDAQAKIALTTHEILPMLSGIELGAMATTSNLADPESALAWGDLRCFAIEAFDDAWASTWTPPAISQDSLAFLQYTSGSTGTPKGVMLNHENLLANSALINQAFRFIPGSEGVIWLPIYHDMGLIGGVLQPLYAGIHCTLMSPLSFLKRPMRWLQTISEVKDKPIVSGGPNFAYDLCSMKDLSPEQKASLNLSHWHTAFSGAEPVRPQTIERFYELYKDCGFRKEAFFPVYGLAEATLFVSGGIPTDEPKVIHIKKSALEKNRIEDTTPTDPDAQTFVGCGQEQGDHKIVIVNPKKFTKCQPGEIGEIWESGKSVAQGYWNRPDLSKDIFQAYLSDTGDGPFLRTGDLGFIRDNELFITGRAKDLIIIRGRNHYPQDIELTVEECHPKLRKGSIAVFSVEVANEERLVIVQEVRTPEVANPEEIFEAIQLTLAKTHELQVWAIVLIKPRTIAKTSSGKIARHSSKNDFLANTLPVVAEWRASDITGKASAPAAPIPAEPASPAKPGALLIQNWLITKLAELARLDPVGIDVNKPFASFGLDSARAVGLTGELEEWLGLPLSPTMIWDYPTPRLLAAFLAGEAPADTFAPKSAPDAVLEAEPIAIVGLGCRFPGANNVEQFWQLLKEGVDAIRDVPAERWKIDDYFAPQPNTPGKLYNRGGGFLDHVDQFDPQFFGISPREAVKMDPQQRLLLEVMWETFENAGIVPDSLAGSNTGVFIGISNNDYSLVQDGDLTQIDAYTGTGNAFSISANRISYLLDLRGPSLALDTACSSSLVSVHLACQSLRTGESDLALAGGVNLILSPAATIIFSQAALMSATSHCRAFDAAADGYVRSEGCGLVVLKRLSDAEKDGDRILAIIQGSAVNQDGRSNGITAPNGLAQQAVIQAALKNAKLEPEQIDYIETHGTGTILGDPIEVQALGAVMKNRSQDKPCLIGSVKTNIGHLESAAGIAGLIKVVLALQNREIPKHILFNQINPHIPITGYPLAIPTEAHPWPGEPRFAGLSSFGFGGTNAHVILSSGPEPIRKVAAVERPRHLLALSAKDPDALKMQVQAFAGYLEMTSEKLADICFTALAGRTHFPFRLAVSGAEKADLKLALDEFLQEKPVSGLMEGVAAPAAGTKTAFLFTGQGAQYAGMGRELYQTQPVFRDALDQCAQILTNYLDQPLLEVVFNDESRLNETAFTQPALFAIEYSLAQLWLAWGVHPDFVLGHSVGEYVAACISGVFSLEDGLKLIAARGRLMSQLPHDGSMAVVFTTETNVQRILADFSDQVGIAGVNGPENIVISGKQELVQQVLEKLAASGVEIRPLKVSHAFHSALMHPMLDEFEKVAREIRYQSPQIPIISNLTGKILSGSDIPDAGYWRRHVREAVQFLAGMQLLAAQGCTVYIETGPHPVLLGMGKRCLPGNKATWLASLNREQANWQSLLESVGKIFVQGLPFDWSRFDAEYAPIRVELPNYPFQRERYWLENTRTAKKSPSTITEMAAGVHPFLGRKILSPLPAQQFEAQLTPEWISRFTKFQLRGGSLLPGLAFAEMALATASPEPDVFGLKSIEINRHALFAENTSATFQTIVEPSGLFQIFRLDTNSGWEVLAAGFLSQTEAMFRNEKFDLAILSRLQTLPEISGAKFYANCQEQGITFDPVFIKIWQDGEEVCAEIDLTPDSNAIRRHPGLLDACFQLMTLFVPASEMSQMWLPARIKVLSGKKISGGRCLAYARRTPNASGIQGDVTVFSESGVILLELQSLALQPLPDSQREILERRTPGSSADSLLTDPANSLDLNEMTKLPIEAQTARLEQYLQQEIAGVLGLAPKRIQLQVPVSHLGLDSIMAIELKNKIESQIKIDYPIANLLEGPSIHQMAGQLADRMHADQDRARVVLAPAIEAVTEFPLSQGQRAMWFQHQMAPDSIFNLRYAVRIQNEIDLAGLKTAFQKLIDRHSSLRTIFVSHRGEPVQQIQSDAMVNFTEIDVRGWNETEFQAQMEAEAHRSFDLEKGPLFRVTVFICGTNDYVLLQTIHHIVADLWSQAIIAQEIGQLYRHVELPSAPLQFSDFVRWQREMLPSPEGARLWHYWKEKLAGEIPVLNLPTDRPRPAVQTFRGSMHTVKLSGELTAKLHELSEQQGVTLFMTLLAAFNVLLYRYTGQEDILVGTPTTGRSHNDLAPIVGYFVNPLPLRTNLSGAAHFTDVLQQVRQTVVGAINHQDYPLALLVEKLQPRRDTSRTPLFQVMFILQRAHLLNEAGLSAFAIGNEANEMQIEGLSMQAVPVAEKTAPFELTLMMAETDHGLAASLTYNIDLFDATTISRMLAQFNQLLISVTEQPATPVSKLKLLTDNEIRQMLIRFNDTRWPFPETKCVHELIELRVEELPDHLSIIFENQRISYIELNQRANQLAHSLRGLGVGPEKIVGICVERSPEMIISLLATLKAGGAYLPMDPDYPAERLALMVEDSRTPIIITQAKFAEKFTGQPVQLVRIDSEAAAIAQSSSENFSSGTTPDNLAYVIYTSGSTGQPKGTLLQHRGLVNFASAHFPALEMTLADKMLQFASFSFDASVSEIFTALFAGATLVLARRETLLSRPRLIELLQTEKVTAAILPPSMLAVLPAEGLPDLQIIISAGENCTAEIVEKWAPGRRFYNGYGPTEATVGPTLQRVQKSTAKIPIGRPLANIRTYLLDAHLNPVPLGVPGELHLGGICVARGYHQRPEMTAEKFIPDAFSAEPGARLYKTGDLARYLPDGTLEFLGRIDHQVKVRGFRIEVGEIENVLVQHDQVKDVLVLAKADQSGMNRLIAYLIPQNGLKLENGELRQYLQARLPEYMVPSLFVLLEHFPLSPNGKIDRNALPDPGDGLDRQATYVKPGNELEQKLAEIWQEVLGLTKVGIHDNFFEIGGHSLAMVKVHATLCEHLQKEISIVEMFKYPTIQALVRFLNETDEKTPLFVEQQARAARQKQALEMQRQRMLNRRK